MWIQLFGVTPTNKQENTEVLAISSLLWIPIVGVVLLVYQFFAWLSHLEELQPYIDIPLLQINWVLITNKVTDLTNLAKNIWFLLYYVFSSVIISYHVAKLIAGKGYNPLLGKINKIRKANGIAPLSRHTTVWDEMFLTNIGQIIEFSNLENPEQRYVGSLVKVPRAHEPDKNIVLEAVDHWSKVMDFYEVRIDHVFIGTSSGTTIKIYNSDEALKAQELYNQRVIDGSIS
jgi:hypothetical protein